MTRRKPLIPNYKLMYESAVTGLQTAYSEYKKARDEEIRWTFIDQDGRFAILGGYEERRKRAENAEAEVARLMELVNELRNKMGGDPE